MFCHKCENKLEVADKFCQFCGTKNINASENKDTSIHKSLKRSDLEKKAWYRALKVIYITFIVIAVIIISVVSWSSKPTKTLDGYNSSIVCDNGKSYAPSRNSIYVYSWESELSSLNDKYARILCKYDTLDFYNYSYSNEFILKNYTFKPVYDEVNYGTWIFYVLITLIISWLIFKVIKLVFFYIVVGSNPNLEDFKKIL